jgi:hypothetical protein
VGTCYAEDTMGKFELDAGMFLLDFVFVNFCLILTIYVVKICDCDIVNSRSLFLVAALNNTTSIPKHSNF